LQVHHFRTFRVIDIAVVVVVVVVVVADTGQ
jgi:hypothetical protein